MFQRQGIGFTNPFQFANPFQQFSGAVNPYTAQGGFGGINPLAAQIGGFGVNPYSPQIGGFGSSPLSWLQQPLPGLINPLYASQFGAGINPVVNPAVNPLVAAQFAIVNPLLQSGIGTVNPLVAAQLGAVNPFLQTGFGTVNPFLQTGTGAGNPMGLGQTQTPGLGADPSVLSLLGQQVNPWLNPIAQHQLPIRPLIGSNPFEQTAGIHGIGSIVDPYTSLVQAQLLSQIANPLHQMYRSFPTNLWATGPGTQPITGHPFSFAQTGVPCGI